MALGVIHLFKTQVLNYWTSTMLPGRRINALEARVKDTRFPVIAVYLCEITYPN